MLRLQFVMDLPYPPGTVWIGLHTFRAVNQELFPLLKMTAPGEFFDRPFEEFPLNIPAFDSLVLLFGWIPVERARVLLQAVAAGAGFSEKSEMVLSKVWSHRRTLSAFAGGCRLVDELAVEPRVLILSPFLRAFIHLVFWNRHRRLKHFAFDQAA